MNEIYEKRTKKLESFKYFELSPLRHIHKDFEIIYTISGSATAYIDEQKYEISSGDLLIIFPNQFHYYNTTVKGEFLVIIITPEVLLNSTPNIYTHIPVNNKIHTNEGEHLRELINKIEFLNDNYPLMIGNICLLLAESFSIFELKPIEQNSILKMLFKYCEKNYTKNIKLENASAKINVSKYHISRLIHKYMKMNFNDYVNSLRITDACNLLNHTNLKISDISEAVGFGSIRSFNRAFKGFMNTTPKEYRKQIRLNPIMFDKDTGNNVKKQSV